MKRYRLHILGVSETHWIQSGQKTLGSGELILFSGREHNRHSEGVASVLGKYAQKSLRGWEPHGERIIMASFQTRSKNINMNIVQIYAPTNEAQDKEKDAFYDLLQEVMDKLPKKDINILMGDANAKIGRENTGYDRIMGSHGLGEMNDNGKRFANFCLFNKMVIEGSIFPHKRVHKATWVSPDNVTENQIDHFCVSQRVRRSLNDVIAQRGADVGSDHHMLLGKLKLRLKKQGNRKEVPMKQYQVNRLDGATKEDFKLCLRNRFQPLASLEEEEDVETHWSRVKEIVDAIKQLNQGKAAGPDLIPPEALKADVNTTSTFLCPLFAKVWTSGKYPIDWKEGHLVKIPKKGDPSRYENYRGITLLSIPGKVFNRVLLNRIKAATDPKLRDEQAGFRSNRSTTDQIATLTIIVEQSLEWNSPLIVNFLDYEKAFDSIDRELLWKIMRNYGIPEKIVSLVRKMYDGTCCRIVHDGQLTDRFNIRTG
ncbi:endonuclease-reverse transcriptase [Elysia marginata]|uniref:Endonuclease-reverse transcriptase n=1 Tax=Elysia marginata TaxID=1093978 RepID=A0AAV4EK70_9GAST|nr:endonuclease-reverse transcriptase [Elysia marginata]